MSEAEKYILNIGFFAHVDAGKTTTTEQILFRTGEIRAAGSVEQGNTKTDSLEIEKKRGISVKASEVSAEYDNTLINIIDTPGHTDFISETERALSVPDGAVLIISASDGVAGQTERLFTAIRDRKLPCIIFINKTDTLKSDCGRVLNEIKTRLSPSVFPLTRAENEGSREVKTVPVEFGEEQISLLCEENEELAEKYINDEKITDAELKNALKKLVFECKAFPLVTGAATDGKGINELIDCICSYFPRHLPEKDGEPAGIIYKIKHDPKMGKVASIKLDRGTLRNRDELTVISKTGERSVSKITQIRKSFGSRSADTGIVFGGDTAELYGLTDAKVGDIFGQDTRALPSMTSPLFRVKAFTSPEKQSELIKAAVELTDEDPLLDSEWVPETKELDLKVMGKVQLEVLGYLLKERYGLDVSFSPPSVIYKETPASTGYGFEAYTMPKPCWAILKLKLEPLPRGSGYIFESIVPTEKLFTRYQNHIKACLPETMKQGRLGWEVTDLKITLVDGEHHLIHTHPLDFFLATPIAFQDGMRSCGSVLLEPYLKLSLTADEDLAGKLIGDMIAMRSDFESPVIKNGRVYMEAAVPVAASLDYAAEFASATSGRGIFNAAFCGYRDCPRELGIISPRRGIDPLDRAKWILFKRGAIQQSVKA